MTRSLFRMARWSAGVLALSAPAQAATSADNHPIIWNFTGILDGASPRGDLLADSALNLYGTSSTAGIFSNGAVFEVIPPPVGSSASGQMIVLYNFTGGADGSLPSGGLIADATGALYGTAARDGAAKGGTVFRLTPPAAGQTAWTETTLWSFGAGTDGRYPVGTLVIATDGSFYGTTLFGGKSNHGTIFKLTPTQGGAGPWAEQVVWNFTGGTDGANPAAGLLTGKNAELVGTTKAGGSGGAGTVFQVTLSNDHRVETTLWSFTGGVDGGQPSGTLLADGAGGYYGTAAFGGGVNPLCDQARFPYYGEPGSENAPAENAAYVPPGGNECGVVFHLSPPGNGGKGWTQSVVWQFQGQTDGANPFGGLLAGPNGVLYGLVSEYGETFWGSEYSLTPPASAGAPFTLTPVASFDGKSQGFYPLGTPIFGLGGLLYGTTSVGGKSWRHVSNYGYGVIYSSLP